MGLAMGSFLNVVIWRLPRGESLVSPPSACPQCRQPIRRRDNIPVVSWLLLRGRCRDCAHPISVRYPAVELLTSGLFVVVVFALRDDAWMWPAWCFFMAIGVALTLIDIDVMRLPNSIVLPAYPVGAVLLAAAIFLGPSTWWDGVRGLIGAAALFVLYAVLWLVKPGGMGLGDVKLAGVVGGYLGVLGFGSLIVGAFAAFVVGGLWSVVLVLAKGGTRTSKVPFGPFMVAGAIVGLTFGEALWSAYRALLVS